MEVFLSSSVPFQMHSEELTEAVEKVVGNCVEGPGHLLLLPKGYWQEGWG